MFAGGREFRWRRRGRGDESTMTIEAPSEFSSAASLRLLAPQALVQRDLTDSFDKATQGDLGQWIDRLRAAGVWADRLHSPDLLGQLHQVLRRPIDTIICNLVDHDPMLRLQGTMAGRFGPVLLAGVGLPARLTRARHLWVGGGTGGSPKTGIPPRGGARKTPNHTLPGPAGFSPGGPRPPLF